MTLTKKNAFRFLFPENRFKYPQKGLRKLVVKVILSVDWNAVFNDIDGILKNIAYVIGQLKTERKL